MRRTAAGERIAPTLRIYPRQMVQHGRQQPSLRLIVENHQRPGDLGPAPYLLDGTASKSPRSDAGNGGAHNVTSAFRSLETALVRKLRGWFPGCHNGLTD